MLKHQKLTLALLLSAGILATGCSKKTDAPAQDTSAPVSETSVAPANPAPVAEQDPEAAQKRDAMEFALMEDAIKNDPKGQWAVSAKASSTYASNPEDPAEGYHPAHTTGAPDVETYGDSLNAWMSKEADKGLESLELDYGNAINATEIRIRQTFNPGAIISVDLYDETGSAHNIWKGPDATQYKNGAISWLNIPFEKTAYKTKRVKITLATNVVPGSNEIDAVQLIGE